MSNVKAGDIAIIHYPYSNDRGHNGKLVAVLDAAPGEKFRLPDGHFAFPACPGDWVCESLGGLFDPMVYEEGEPLYRRQAKFSVINDRYLRPIRDSDGEDQTLQWAGHPKTAEIRKGVEMLEKAVERLQRMADELQKGRV